ncbi:hypothetical protein GPUN_2155 [Glaciecola punicea ACAM 611]|uniref:Sel1 repeat family protein n=1 Tax=Glaciecola punicea ACAM 611 TaxID=1121923 RepID=H5TD93_9ALTE|nr:hypothetical protein [Glaciecola punicea]GAB56270.1 hypothetical protein GPUN_2155 [Glaciecola punicea ACAM 611]
MLKLLFISALLFFQIHVSATAEKETPEIELIQQLAQDGDAEAQYELGTMYLLGEGVLQSFITSYSWANISRYNGADAKLLFDFLENEMSMNDISKAQALSKRCLESNYKNCGS